MIDHINRTRQIFYHQINERERIAIKRDQQIYRALTEPYIQMMCQYMENMPKPPFAVAVHNVDSLVPFEELDHYL